LALKTKAFLYLHGMGFTNEVDALHHVLDYLCTINEAHK